MQAAPAFRPRPAAARQSVTVQLFHCHPQADAPDNRS